MSNEVTFQEAVEAAVAHHQATGHDIMTLTAYQLPAARQCEYGPQCFRVNIKQGE